MTFGEQRLARVDAYAAAMELEFSALQQRAIDEYIESHPAPASMVVLKSTTEAPPEAASSSVGALEHHKSTAQASQEHQSGGAVPSPLALPSPSGSVLFPVPPSPPTQIPPLQVGGNATSERAELDWRAQEVWEAHLRTRERWYRAEDGRVPPAAAKPRAEVRKAIVEALREFDADRLGPDDRERWRRESPVRAAGQGIFLSDWHTGHGKGADAVEGRRYLEDFRPWKRLRGKGSPVPGFAALAFEARSHRAKD